MQWQQHAFYEFITFFNKMYYFTSTLNRLHFVTPPYNNNYGFDSTYEMVYFIFNCLYSHLHEVKAQATCLNPDQNSNGSQAHLNIASKSK